MGEPQTPTQRLTALGIDIPEAPAPAAAYVPWVVERGMVYVAGQVAVASGELLHRGRVGWEVTVEQAAVCARQCGINVLAQLHAAAGGLDNIGRILKLTVFVASAHTFTDQHLVANAASELMTEVFGDDGRHARSAVGVAELPLGSPVEVEAIATLRAG